MLELSPPEREHTAAIDQAAEFLTITPPGDRPVPLVPAMREMFGLSTVEACAAITQAHAIVGGADAIAS